MSHRLFKGDLEKEMDLDISPLCDRNTINIPQSQIGFITYIIEPTFHLLSGTSGFRLITSGFWLITSGFYFRLSETSLFVAREFLPVVLEEDKTKSRISTERNFKAIRTNSLNIKYDSSCNMTLVCNMIPFRQDEILVAINRFTELWSDHLMENKENWLQLDSDGINQVPVIRDDEPLFEPVFEPEPELIEPEND